MKPTLKKDDFRGLASSSLAVLLTLVLYFGGAFEGVENRTIDFRFRWRGDLQDHARVVVVAADEASIRELGRWPWPRHLHGEVLDVLVKAGARAVAFDVLFTEPDKDRPWSDARLGEAARRGGKAVFGMVFHYNDRGEAVDPLFPIEPLFGGNVRAGFVNFFPETVDGVCRRAALWVEHAGRLFPSLSLAALSIAEGLPPEELVRRMAIPVSGPWNEFILNFTGGFQSFPYHSFVDVLKGRADPAAFKDAIVIVGGTATALFDFKPVPNVPNFPGLEIHATAIDNYINKRWLRPASPGLVAAVTAVFGLLCGFLAVRAPVWAGAASAAVLLGYFMLCQFLFSSRHQLLDFMPPAFCVLGSYLAVFFQSFLVERRKKLWIKHTFSQYLSPKVVDAVTKNPALLKLGGEDREMTVFFSDLAGFTAISESLSPRELVSVLNEYLTEMSNVIHFYGGVVDKYIGDAIMAFWNAPIDQPGHAALGCLTALDQLKKLDDLQKRFAARGLPSVTCRIGINTGRMVVGNMGSNSRFDYTVMGDSVNLASRLEGANKPFHTRVMISEFTYEKAKNDVEVRQLDLLRLPGKKVPVKVYELLAKKDGLTTAQKAGIKIYMEGLNFYRYRDFQKAADKFKKVLEQLPGDGPSRTYVERCEKFLLVPPPSDWDGVFVVDTK